MKLSQLPLRALRLRVSLHWPPAGAKQARRPFSNTAGTAMLHFLSPLRLPLRALRLRVSLTRRAVTSAPLGELPLAADFKQDDAGRDRDVQGFHGCPQRDAQAGVGLREQFVR